MSIVGRAARRMGREIKKYSRLRHARREGLVYVEPNFVYRPDLSSESVVIDAGCSYEADFSVCLMRRHGVRAFGVDPTRKHGEALHELEEQHGGRFVHVPCAVGAADGVLTFHESRVNESGSLLDDHVNVVHDEITSYDVEALTLTSLLKRLALNTVDVLKLDLEGAEYDLLERATPEQLHPFRQVFVEFHHHAVGHYTESDTRRIVGVVCGYGFKAFSLDDHNYLFYRAH
jgi:FkbM family methyltransferase